MKLNTRHQTRSLREYWKTVCSCLYPGRGPGPGPGQAKQAVKADKLYVANKSTPFSIQLPSNAKTSLDESLFPTIISTVLISKRVHQPEPLLSEQSHLILLRRNRARARLRKKNREFEPEQSALVQVDDEQRELRNTHSTMSQSTCAHLNRQTMRSNHNSQIETHHSHLNLAHSKKRTKSTRCSQRRSLFTSCLSTHLDRNLTWIFLTALAVCSSLSLVGCKNDNLLVSNCQPDPDENYISSSSNQRLGINYTNNRKCNYTSPSLEYFNSYLDNNTSPAAVYSTTMSTRSSSDSRFITSSEDFVRERKQNDNLRSTEGVRLEAIKLQILSRLGLKDKPNIKHTMSRKTALRILNQADNPSYDFHNRQQNVYFIGAENPSENVYGGYGAQTYTNGPDYKVTNQYYEAQEQQYNSQKEQSTYPYVYQHNQQQQPDYDELVNDENDFFGRTREIIAVASKGE